LVLITLQEKKQIASVSLVVVVNYVIVKLASGRQPPLKCIQFPSYKMLGQPTIKCSYSSSKNRVDFQGGGRGRLQLRKDQNLPRFV